MCTGKPAATLLLDTVGDALDEVVVGAVDVDALELCGVGVPLLLLVQAVSPKAPISRPTATPVIVLRVIVFVPDLSMRDPAVTPR